MSVTVAGTALLARVKSKTTVEVGVWVDGGGTMGPVPSALEDEPLPEQPARSVVKRAKKSAKTNDRYKNKPLLYGRFTDRSVLLLCF
jgi:hypothetical protein